MARMHPGAHGGASPRPCSLPPRSRRRCRRLMWQAACTPRDDTRCATCCSIVRACTMTRCHRRRGSHRAQRSTRWRSELLARVSHARVRARHELDVFECGLSVRAQMIGMPRARRSARRCTRLVLSRSASPMLRLARTRMTWSRTRMGQRRRLSSGMGLSRAHDRIARRGGAAARSIAARRPVVLGLVARHARELPLGDADPGHGPGRRRAMVSD